ncbi:multifunctional protein ADE2-like [Gigantopelta aegis]|uniref:multifunctional protein ADE2-like n=1 Tax=Gigantopelta aegis TaxID=1735272 RepID=UPI001B88DC1F|nr:multifunctional protein ADE2-like [Gigantopelta aegis]
MEPETVELGDKIVEGKTKIVYSIVNNSSHVVLKSKDCITAGDGLRADNLEGKAAIATCTTVAIFKLLSDAGIKTHFVKEYSDTAFIGNRCAMIPIEWVTRRIATGSFLRRNPGVQEGYRFCPPKLETFFKDDANNDPQWSHEQCIAAKLKIGGFLIGPDEISIMSRLAVTVFEILEHCWATLICTLVDMKIEFGVIPESGEIVVADVIDSDSWRLWPLGDRRLMKDKQVYRELKQVTPEALENVKRNFQWVANKVQTLSSKPNSRAVIFMGSASDMPHAEKIIQECKSLGVPCEIRVMSAHKATQETLNILAEYEGEGIPTVFIAVAGRSNGLGPVLSGNASWPVINCPPITTDWGPHDIWSSLRLPSGLGCSTVISPEAAGLQAAQILGLSNHLIWNKLRARQTNTWISLKTTDKKFRDDK